MSIVTSVYHNPIKDYFSLRLPYRLPSLPLYRYPTITDALAIKHFQYTMILAWNLSYAVAWSVGHTL